MSNLLKCPPRGNIQRPCDTTTYNGFCTPGSTLYERSYYSRPWFVEAKQRVSVLTYSVLSGNNSISNVFLYFRQCFQWPANSAYPRPQVFTTDEPINGTLLCRSSGPCGNPGLCGCIPSTLPTQDPSFRTLDCLILSPNQKCICMCSVCYTKL